MNLEVAKNAFLNLVNSIREEDKCEFYLWCKSQCQVDQSRAYFDLRTIAEDIKTIVPKEAILSSEKIDQSLILEKFGGNKEPVIHIDSFLYEDEHIDALVEEGKLSRNFCRSCGSTDVAPNNIVVELNIIAFISHSASIQRIEFLFQCMLPDLKDKVLLDVGSRLGAVLYGAYYCSSAKQIIGVEFNEDLCKLQNHIVNKYMLNDRIQVICDNICHLPEVVCSAHVIVLNNVFECFMGKEMQRETWLWLRNTIKPGTLMVTVPSIEETLSPLQVEIEVSRWLKEIPVADALMDDQDLISDVCMYLVL